MSLAALAAAHLGIVKLGSHFLGGPLAQELDPALGEVSGQLVAALRLFLQVWRKKLNI